jgi:DNA-binding transcriptional ArsR family regulator
MTAGMDMAEIAALVGDPGRANMLAAMLDGRAHTATELARLAGIAAPTASGHLGKLKHGGLITVVSQGRHRYFRLASVEVARMLEGIMVVAVGKVDTPRRATPRVDPELRRARTCYDHIAGELGVAIADALVKRGAVELSDDGAAVTPSGRAWLSDVGFALECPRGGRRPLCRPCLDWSERRPHLAGTLGAAFLERSLSTGLLQRRQGSRALELRGQIEDILSELGLPSSVR